MWRLARVSSTFSANELIALEVFYTLDTKLHLFQATVNFNNNDYIPDTNYQQQNQSLT